MPVVDPPLLQVLAVVLLVVQVGLGVPQLVRLVRVSDAGVPLAGEAISLATGAGWLVWSVMAGEPAMAASAVLALLGYGPTTWVLLRRGRPWRLAAGVVAAVALVQAVGLVVGGLSLLATLLTAAAVVQYGAYLAAAARCDDWTGFSMPSGVLRIGYGLGWAWYGHLGEALAVLVWGVLTATTFSVTLTLASRDRRRRRPGAPPGPAGAGTGTADPSSSTVPATATG